VQGELIPALRDQLVAPRHQHGASHLFEAALSSPGREVIFLLSRTCASVLLIHTGRNGSASIAGRTLGAELEFVVRPAEQLRIDGVQRVIDAFVFAARALGGIQQVLTVVEIAGEHLQLPRLGHADFDGCALGQQPVERDRRVIPVELGFHSLPFSLVSFPVRQNFIVSLPYLGAR
jgi:hypothetical protein